jgi:DNA-binding MltR family transcriptional regulator
MNLKTRNDVKKALSRVVNGLMTGKLTNISKAKALVYALDIMLKAFKHDDEMQQFREQMEMDKKIYEYEKKLMEIEEYLKERGL